MLISAAFTASLAILITLLAINVSRYRITRRVSLGDAGDRKLNRLVRAHGNAVEHAVVMVPLLLLYELNGGNVDLAALLAASFLLARIVHAWALSEKASTLRRMASAGVSYLLELLTAVLVLAQVFM